MIHLQIRPVWRFRGESSERDFDFQLVAILAGLEASGKLTHAAEQAGLSYRHAWNLVSEWEAFFGARLVTKSKGRGSQLTALGKRLLWAGQRAQARLAPELENLASEFAGALNEALEERPAALAMHASHDFAVGLLRDQLSDGPSRVALQYKGSFDALASLRRGECDVAGFHVPEGALGTVLAQRYAECLPPGHGLIAFVTREHGLIVRAGNPKEIAGVEDLCREGVRMVNRQRGSGTRALLELMISSRGLDRASMDGYENEEITHGAVAALIAGNQADVGFGVQAAAAQYRLGFIPLCRERYFLACRAGDLESAPMRQLRRALRGAAFRERVKELAGYSAENAGEVVDRLDTAVAG
ncbi:MAG TPA: substrate-binding domain-containing protein [Usitatibacter sp.]|nr:substrate-binding domain-containing protein [Usitatibacter sp.]